MSLPTFDADTLHQFTRAFEQLFDAGDATAMTSYYTDDGYLMAEGMHPIRGQAAITAFWRTAIERAGQAGARRTIELHEWQGSGDMGYALCTVVVAMPAATITVWDATIWRRDAQGRWRIAVDISTPLPPK